MTTIRDAFQSPAYVALETPSAARLVWSYRYWRAQASTRTAEMALFNARKDIAEGKTRYPMHNQGYGNPAFTIRSFENVRWIENPRAAGLRFVGYADELAGLRYTGHYSDDSQSETIRGVVFQIAGKDGKARFVPGYDNAINGKADSNGPCAVCFEEVFEGEGDVRADSDHYGAHRDCARRADQLAEWLAEDERDYQEAASAGLRYHELADDIASTRKEALALLAERRAAMAQSNGQAFPTICGTIADKVRALYAEIQSMRAKRAELLDNFGHRQAFIDA